MILEHAILNVKPGESPAFLSALKEALPLIAATPGFIDLDVRACLETPDRFLLLVRWKTVEAHTQGFRTRNATSNGAPCCISSTIPSRSLNITQSRRRRLKAAPKAKDGVNHWPLASGP